MQNMKFCRMQKFNQMKGSPALFNIDWVFVCLILQMIKI